MWFCPLGACLNRIDQMQKFGSRHLVYDQEPNWPFWASYMGLHTKHWFGVMVRGCEGIRQPDPPGLWANLHYVLIDHTLLNILLKG